MSDLFMNMQRQHQQRRLPTTVAAAASPTRSKTKSSRNPAGPYELPNSFSNKQTYAKDYLDNDVTSEDDDDDDAEEEIAEDDPLANILSLKLRKPSHWKWELTTSKSCTNIALPRILLYDHKGKLLVDAPAGGNGCSEQVYKQVDFERPRQSEKSKKRPYNSKRSVTTNLTHSVRKALAEEFDGLQIEELNTTTNSSGRQRSLLTTPSSSTTNTTMRSRRSRKPIELNTADLPDLSRRSSSLRGVRFNVLDENETKISEFLPTPPSTTTPTTSSSSGPREKRKYRRSQSSGRSSSRSESILERMSFQKGRYSSPDSEEEEPEQNRQLPGPPRYLLRTDKAGTLLVHKDSLNSQNSRRLRVQKYASSAESIIKSESPKQNAISPQTPSEASTTHTKERRRKLLPVRRYLTDGNLFRNQLQLPTSDEEQTVAAKEKALELEKEKPCPTLGSGCTCRQQRRYKRNETKDLNPSISPLGLLRNGKIR